VICTEGVDAHQDDAWSIVWELWVGGTFCPTRRKGKKNYREKAELHERLHVLFDEGKPIFFKDVNVDFPPRLSSCLVPNLEFLFIAHVGFLLLLP
jgi:hypothetical protein